MLTIPAKYRIRVQGQLGSEWAAWFGGLTLSWQEPDQTVFTGQVVDQAALHGILNTVRDLGLPKRRCSSRIQFLARAKAWAEELLQEQNIRPSR